MIIGQRSTLLHQNTKVGGVKDIKPKTLIFDGVFDHTKNQQDIFKDVKNYVNAVIDGQKVCIFAYGQTGAGKTYTMEGNMQSQQQK